MTENQMWRLNPRSVVLFLIACTLFLAVYSKRSPAKAAGVDERSFHGVVKDESGAPVKGIWVQALNLKTKILTSTLSDRQGRYWFDSLAPGEYEVTAKAVGFTTDRRKDVKVGAGQAASLDFTLRSRPVRWTELSWNDFVKLLPERPGKEEMINQSICAECHGFGFLAMHQRDLSGWRQTVNWMRKEMDYILGRPSFGGEPRVSDAKAELIASYLASVFGPEADLPQYPEIKPREYNDEAMNIVYVEYEMPTRRAFPWSGAPDNQGSVWIPHYNSNQIAKLNPKTGEVREYKVPHPTRAAVHSAVPAPDGMVWVAEASEANKIAKFDPKTETFTEYLDPREVGRRRKHTVIVDVKGKVWGSGSDVIVSFDPKAERFSYYGDKPLDAWSYGIAADKEGNVYFARREEHTFGKIDAKTGKVTEWEFPNTGPRRVHVDSKGYVWFGMYYANKASRFDPRSETFKEYPLPGDPPGPYAIGIDARDNFWYFSRGSSEIGRLDPNSGHVTRYPVPYDDITDTMRDFFRDSDGRMWFSAPAANKVGYFYLRNGE